MENHPDQPADPHADLRHSLPREAFQEIMLILRGALPPPLSDDPADEALRDRAAMAAVAALGPVTAAEGRLAAQFVAADAWAMDCLRLAGERKREFEVARKCRAQAMSLMREGKSALRVLLRLQAIRAKVDGDEVAAGHAAWVEHAAVRMMAEVLDGDAEAGAGGRDFAGDEDLPVRGRGASLGPAAADCRPVSGSLRPEYEEPERGAHDVASAGRDARREAGHEGGAGGGGAAGAVAAGVGGVSWRGTNPADVQHETAARFRRRPLRKPS